MKNLIDKLTEWLRKAAEAVRDRIIHLFGGYTHDEYMKNLKRADEADSWCVAAKSSICKLTSVSNILLMPASERASVTKCVETFQKKALGDFSEALKDYISVDISGNEFIATLYVYDKPHADRMLGGKMPTELKTGNLK